MFRSSGEVYEIHAKEEENQLMAVLEVDMQIQADFSMGY